MLDGLYNSLCPLLDHNQETLRAKLDILKACTEAMSLLNSEFTSQQEDVIAQCLELAADHSIPVDLRNLALSVH
jgi:uncharacterized protein with NRDE domain